MLVSKICVAFSAFLKHTYIRAKMRRAKLVRKLIALPPRFNSIILAESCRCKFPAFPRFSPAFPFLSLSRLYFYLPLLLLTFLDMIHFYVVPLRLNSAPSRCLVYWGNFPNYLVMRDDVHIQVLWTDAVCKRYAHQLLYNHVHIRRIEENLNIRTKRIYEDWNFSGWPRSDLIKGKSTRYRYLLI